MPPPVALSPPPPPGDALRRLLGHRRGAASWGRIARRGAAIGIEIARAALAGTADTLLGRVPGVLRTISEGNDPRTDARRVALYVHYSPSGRVTDMVMMQLRAYADAGFAIVFVSMSRTIPPEDWARLGKVVALRVLRENHALDFGAWQALVPLVTSRWPQAEELLLANDSVLGPIRPLAPLIAALRESGPGVFGLSESLQGGAHLQSYFVLARGAAAVADLLAWLRALRLTRSKWLLIQRAEMRLGQQMRARGHTVAALYPYPRVVEAAVADLAYLNRLPSRLAPPGAADDPAAWRALLLHRRPLNPAHHLWRPLVEQLGFPFIKTELIRRNPGEAPDLAAWPTLIGPDSPCPPEMLQAHLREMAG